MLVQEIIIETLYDNTVFKNASAGLSLGKSKSNESINELSSLLQFEESTTPAKSMSALIAFLEETGLEYINMYIVDKKVVKDETIYTLGHLNNDKTFAIRVKPDTDVVHVSISKQLGI